MEKVILDSERPSLLEGASDLRSYDFFKVIVTQHVDSGVHTSHLAVRTDCVSAFMESVYDLYDNDTVIQFNGIFQLRDPRFWFTMV